MALLHRRTLAVFILIILPSCSDGVSQQVLAQELSDYLFANYSRSLIPVCQAGHNVTLKMDIALRQIIELNEREQKLSTNIWMRLRWTDCRLTWDPASYNGTTYIMKTYPDIWVPDITLYDSSADEVMFPGREDYRAYIDSSGTVSYNFPTVINSVCRVDVTYFPMDTQRCQLQFGSWSHHGFELDVHSKNPTGDLASFYHNSEWIVTEFPIERHVFYYSCCTEPYPDVTFYIVMERRPTFYVLTMIFPCILTSTVAAFTFILPVESGEKVSLEITVLLSLAVFMLLVSESMPPSSDNFPIVGTYFAVSMVLVSLSLLQTIIVLNVFFRGTNGRHVPRWMKVVFLQYLARLVCVRTNRIENDSRDTPIEISTDHMKDDHSGHDTHNHMNNIDHKIHRDPVMEIDKNDDETGAEIGGKNGMNRPVGGILPSLAFQREPTLETHVQNQLKHLKNIDSYFQRKQHGHDINAEWRDLSNVLDRLCLLVYIFVTIIVSLAFLLQCAVQ